ncbi:winged helix-turn-helix transcriptional regulator [Roseinatronobacter alkalisoli]
MTERLAGMTARELVRRDETKTYPREVTYILTARSEALRYIISDLYD